MWDSSPNLGRRTQRKLRRWRKDHPHPWEWFPSSWIDRKHRSILYLAASEFYADVWDSLTESDRESLAHGMTGPDWGDFRWVLNKDRTAAVLYHPSWETESWI